MCLLHGVCLRLCFTANILINQIVTVQLSGSFAGKGWWGYVDGNANVLVGGGVVGTNLTS